jgi:hypothetical protein
MREQENGEIAKDSTRLGRSETGDPSGHQLAGASTRASQPPPPSVSLKGRIEGYGRLLGWRSGAGPPQASEPPPRPQRRGIPAHRPLSRLPATLFRALAPCLGLSPGIPSTCRGADARADSGRSVRWRHRRSGGRRRDASGTGGRLGWKAHRKHRSGHAGAVDRRGRRAADGSWVDARFR